MSDTRKLGVVFASAEAAPFVKTGGLGDVAGSLPPALEAEGVNVIVMVPLYSTIPEEYQRQMEHLCDFYVPLGWRNEYCGLERLVHDGVTYLFVDNKRYFDRSYPYGFFDDGERFAFFSKAIVESLQHLPEGFTCDILHCNDWQTALAPVFLREFYQGLPLYENVRTIFSIHNVAFQGQFTDKMLNDVLGLAHIPAAASQLRCDDSSINYMMGALNYADAITTVSPTYAAEIQTPAFGERLDGVLRRRSEALQGIVNGIDVNAWNPATDKAIAATYTAEDLSGKAACKRALQEELGLEVRDDRPLMTMVTRLTRQKGMDLVTYALDRILSGGVQVAVLGTGDYEYENALRYFEGKYPGQMSARIQFDAALSKRMYAGSDLFLMPSLFEPCGLSQMIAMRYGTLPVVRETGGLRDTVAPYNYVTGEGTGFSFANFNGDEMGDAVFRGARLFWDDPEAFHQLRLNAMSQDFSWKKSADKYLDLYFWMHPEVPRRASEAVVDAEDAAKPEAKVEPVAEQSVAPAAKKPAAKVESAEKPIEKKPAAKVESAEKPIEKKPAAKGVTKPKAASKPAAKPATRKTAAKAASAKAAAEKPAAEKTSEATKPAAKSATKTAPKKTAAAPAAKPAAQSPAKAAVKTAPKATIKTAAKPAEEKAATKATVKMAEAKAATKATAVEPAKTEVKAPAKPAAHKTAHKTTATKPTAKPAASAKSVAEMPVTAKRATKAASAEATPAVKAAASSKPVAEVKPAEKKKTVAKPAPKHTAAKPAAKKETPTSPKHMAEPAPAEKPAVSAPAKPAAKPVTKTRVSAAKKPTTRSKRK